MTLETSDPICQNCNRPTSEHVSAATWLAPDQSASKFICPTSVLVPPPTQEDR